MAELKTKIITVGIITASDRCFNFIVNQACKFYNDDVRKHYRMISRFENVRGRDFGKIGLNFDQYDVKDLYLILDYIYVKGIKVEKIKDDLILIDF
jgi:hypothetical protein